MLYGFLIWFNVSRNQINTLCILERKCLRNCINFEGPRNNNNKYISNVRLYKESNTVPLIESMMMFSIKCLNNLENHPNNHMRQLYENINDAVLLQKKRYRPPQFLISANKNNLIYERDTVIFYETLNRKYPPIQ